MTDAKPSSTQRIGLARWLPVILAAALASCHDEPLLPDDGPALEAAPIGLAVSEPIGDPAVGNLAAGAQAHGLAYVSADPGTFPSGVSATVTNSATGESVTAAMSEGGFDPVAIAGTAGDELAVRVRSANGSSLSYGLIVPVRLPPRVIRTRPTKDAVAVTLNSSVVVVFSEPVARTTIKSENIKLELDGEPVGAALSLDERGLIATLSPEQSLEPEATYTLEVTTDVKDLAGDALEEAVSLHFRTEIRIASAIVIVSGQDQSAKAGEVLDEPLVVRLVDGYGEGMANMELAWRISEGDGQLLGGVASDEFPGQAVSTRTDADGFAQVSFMPREFGLFDIVVSGPVTQQPVFTFDTSDPEALLSMVSGDEQDAKAGRQLPNPYVVRVTDGQGDAVGNVRVEWSIEYGEGYLSLDESGASTTGTTYTNPDGLAEVGVTPTWFGPVLVVASTDGTSGSPVRFYADAVDHGASIAIVSGDAQEGKTGEALAEPFVVRITDSEGDVVPNVLVEWSSGRSTYTDTNGLAQKSFAPSRVGFVSVSAQPAGLGTMVTFTTDVNVLVIHYIPPAWLWAGGFFGPSCPGGECQGYSDEYLPLGAAVEWVNDYPTARIKSTSAPAGGAVFDSGALGENERFQFVPDAIGTWEYVDEIRGKIGRITVY